MSRRGWTLIELLIAIFVVTLISSRPGSTTAGTFPTRATSTGWLEPPGAPRPTDGTGLPSHQLTAMMKPEALSPASGRWR